MLGKVEPAEYSIKTRNDTDIMLTRQYQVRNSCLDLSMKEKGLGAGNRNRVVGNRNRVLGNRNRWVTGRHNVDRTACQAKSIQPT